MSITTIAIDTAKSVFQLHGVDAAGTPMLKKRTVHASNGRVSSLATEPPQEWHWCRRRSIVGSGGSRSADMCCSEAARILLAGGRDQL
jgi:hypothetical protein